MTITVSLNTKKIDILLMSFVLVWIILLSGCTNYSETQSASNQNQDTITQQDSFNYRKNAFDQVININGLMYEAYPLSIGIDWNLKTKVPYPCDSFFEVRGIYYDNEYECWRISNQVYMEQEQKSQISQTQKSTIHNPQELKETTVTQYVEKAPSVESIISKPKQEKTTEESKTANPRALFKGIENSQEGCSEGTTGQSGDQGKSNEIVGIKNYEGVSGRNNEIGYNLSGRSIKFLHQPDNDYDEEGIVVVYVWVNREGKVIRAEVSKIGTTILNQSQLEQAKQAALRSTFAPDPDAPEEQSGSITYNFVFNY